LQRAGNAAHRGKIGHALVVDPVPKLFGAEWFFAGGGDHFGELVA
jgi:hypothetical protein